MTYLKADYEKKRNYSSPLIKEILKGLYHRGVIFSEIVLKKSLQ